MREKTIKLLLIIILGSFTFGYSQSALQVDILVKNAWVFDGTGSDSVLEDVGITGDRISFIGDSKETKVVAKKVVDAEEMFLCPGFIDPHTHYGSWLNSDDPAERANIPCLSQGVTTVFLGSDGFGTYQIAERLEAYEKNRIGTNVALWVGFGSVRKSVLGNVDITPNDDQLNEEKKRVAQAMQEGALGLSTGLFYTPQTYSKTPEVIALAKVAEKYGGVYDTHMRSESEKLVQAVQEVIDIGRSTGIPVHISHIKCLGPSAWGKSEKIIKMVDDARSQEIDVKGCQYPYLASHTSLSAMLMPPWAKSGGDKAMLRRINNPDTLAKILKELSIKLAIRGGDSRITLTSDNDAFNGKTLHQVAAAWGVSPEEAAIRIFKQEPDIGANSYSMIESDVDNFMKQPWVMTCSDGGSRNHPRTYGTFDKKIREYVLNKHLLSMSEAIHRATGEVAAFFGLKKRGFIRKGYYADIVIFDPHTVRANSTYVEPRRLASGIMYVFVNGTVAVAHGKYTGTLAGEPLRH